MLTSIAQQLLAKIEWKHTQHLWYVDYVLIPSNGCNFLSLCQQHRLRVIRHSLRPRVSLDYLRRTLSSTFQFVLTPTGNDGRDSPAVNISSGCSVMIPLYLKTPVSSAHYPSNYYHPMFTPTAPSVVSRSLHLDSGLPAPVLEFPDTDGIGEETLGVAVEASNSPVARYVCTPLVRDLISTLYAADDRVTSYATQFLKALYVSRDDISFRVLFSETIRECTKVRGLRARIFEYTRTNLGVERLRESSTATVGVSRDHLNSILDLLLLCISVPLETYSFTNKERITRHQAFNTLVVTFCNTITDCLQTVGSGLGMNAGTADGIYSQNHLVERILRCVNVLMNTACMYDNLHAQWNPISILDHVHPLRRRVLLTLLRRMLYSWPHPFYGSNGVDDGSAVRPCTIHPLLLQSSKRLATNVTEDFQIERLEGSIEVDSDSYLAVRVNSPNAVREEAYLSTCFELLCCNTCIEAYELHRYLAKESLEHSPDELQRSVFLSHPNDESVNGLLDTTVNRILSKIVQGIESNHFKLSLRCISCFHDRGLFLLQRYFIPLADSVEDPSSLDAESICPICPSCSTCELHRRRREARLDALVSALRSARGDHWNSRVRATAGELLDQMIDMI